MMSQYFEGQNSGSYDELSKMYADYWSEHDPNAYHYLQTRTALMKWSLDLRDQGLRPKDGTMVIVGPGVDVANNRDLEPGWLEAEMTQHPSIVIADFSNDLLRNAYNSLTGASKKIQEKILLTRRDITEGLSVQFMRYIENRIDAVSTPDELHELMEFIAETKVEDIENYQIESLGSVNQGRPEVNGIDNDVGMAFTEITKNTEPVRFIVSNLVLAGTFAITEKSFREKLLSIAQMFPEEISQDTVSLYLHKWHLLIQKLNQEVATRYFVSAQRAHPEAHHLATIDKDVLYKEYDEFPRLDLEQVKINIAKKNIPITLRRADKWTLDDSKEDPPHNHSVIVVHGIPRGEIVHNDE